MVDHADLLLDLDRIWAAARESEDGNRCAVAPHPELRDRIKSALDQLNSASGLPRAFTLKAVEPTPLGLNDGVILPPEHFAFGVAPSQIRQAAAARPPLRGVVRVIVVLVEFGDKAMTQTRQHFDDLFFSQGVVATKSVREYYSEVTNGLIDLQGQVVGPFRLPRALKDYAHGASGMGALSPNAQTMARDALMAADPFVNFTPFDNDGNGFVDAFIVVHAGSGGEQTGSGDDIWSHKWLIEGGAKAVDSTHVYGYLTVPEDCRIGVCAHELGHLLFGFPDLYDTDQSSEGIGNWCLMAAGSWGGNGDTPVHPSAWCKMKQQWVSVDNPTGNGPVTLGDVKASHRIVRLWKKGAASDEYFLLENRQKAGFDVSLPAGGLLIWHIDEGQAGNTNEAHYKVALMQADGHRDMEQNRNRGDAGDPYPGTGHNVAFSKSSSPSSRSYAGGDTKVSVTGIPAAAASMKFDVKVK
jgi:immune inhibitor A